MVIEGIRFQLGSGYVNVRGGIRIVDIGVYMLTNIYDNGRSTYRLSDRRLRLSLILIDGGYD